MVEIKQILCPVDLSDTSRHALEHAFAFARWYKARVTVLISGTPRERRILDAVQRRMKHAAIDLSTQGTTLGALKDIVRRCDLMITNDTGPRHIAAAFDVPVVTVFGPTHPDWTEIYFPRERKVAVQVFCGPCQKKICPLDHRCMTRISVDAVVAAVQARLDARAA